MCRRPDPDEVEVPRKAARPSRKGTSTVFTTMHHPPTDPSPRGASTVLHRSSSSWLTPEFRIVAADEGITGLVARAGPGSFLAEVTVDPLDRGDTRPLQQVFDELSPASRRMRFLGATPRLAPELARRLADVDHDNHGCWVAGISGEPVGIARYIRMVDDPTVAEIALEVVDPCQGHGLGRLLLDVVGAAAADVGITSLLWLMDEDNRRVRRLAAPLGGRFASDQGVLEGTTALPQVPPFSEAQIVRCARAARRRAANRAAA